MVSVGRLFGGRRVRRRRRGSVATLIPSWQLVHLPPPAPVPPMKLTRRRKYEIVRAYVLATGGRLPTDLEQLLAAMRELLGDVTEGEVREAIKQTLREGKREVVRRGAWVDWPAC